MPKNVVWFGVILKYVIRNTRYEIFYILAALLLLPVPAYAQGLTREECFQDTIARLGCLPFYLGNVVNGIFALSGIAAVILIILSGIRLLVSGGDAEKVAKAKKSLFYSIVGFLIVLFSFLILRVISFVTGAECINALGFNSCS